jgi:hypothetical protein
MCNAQHLLADGNGPLEQRLYVFRVTALAQQPGEIAEDSRRLGMLRAVNLLENRQCALVEEGSKSGRAPARSPWLLHEGEGSCSLWAEEGEREGWSVFSCLSGRVHRRP